MRKLDITDKLSFEENPALIIKGVEIEVNADTATVLQIMELVKSGDTGVDGVLKAYHMLFPEESVAKIDAMKFRFPDFSKIVNLAMELVAGEVGEMGETQIPATT